jgi:diguanylate cyclase (GGDEF)-like protein
MVLAARQLVELLTVVSAVPDDAAAARAAAARAAAEHASRSLEAEVAAVVVDGELLASVGFRLGRAPRDLLVAAAASRLTVLEVPGAGRCSALVIPMAERSGHVLVARSGDDGFSADERHLVRGMTQILELGLRTITALDVERAHRHKLERRSRENRRLMEKLQQHQRMLEQFLAVQRAIARREPLQRVLDTITTGARDLLGNAIVGLWLIDPDDSTWAVLASSVGLDAQVTPTVWRIPVLGSGPTGEAMLLDRAVTGAQPSWLPLLPPTDRSTHLVTAVPVHVAKKVAGSLLVAPDPRLMQGPTRDEETLQTFADHVSLAVTDARTLDDMHRAAHDQLTGLATRSLFVERCRHELAAAARNGVEVGLLFLDLDRFKLVNDSLGHAAGDDLLVEVAHRVQDCLRPNDLAARFGGDEFAVMLCGVTPSHARAVMDRLDEAIGRPVTLFDTRVDPGASIGMALSRPGHHELDALLREADLAMYEVKRLRRGDG